jgi:hypothetical protein
MQLWILKPINDNAGPWKPWFDRVFGFVIRAKNEADARGFAAEACGPEGEQAWLDETLSTCESLVNRGEPGVILFHDKSA